MNPNDQTPKPELTQEHQDNIKNSLYTKKTELQRLEEDLKYMTGKSDRLEIEKKIKDLKEEISNSPEKKMMDLENEKNYTPGMSFSSVQKSAIKGLANPYHYDLFNKGEISDIRMKRGLDSDMKEARALDKHFNKNIGMTIETPQSEIDYHEAFSKEGEPFWDEKEKVEREYLELERRRQEDIRFVVGKVDYLRRLEERLLEAKARAKTKILGGKDTTETLPIEKEILQIKSDIALGVTMAASTYLGLSIDKSDMGL